VNACWASLKWKGVSNQRRYINPLIRNQIDGDAEILHCWTKTRNQSTLVPEKLIEGEVVLVLVRQTKRQQSPITSQELYCQVQRFL